MGMKSVVSAMLIGSLVGCACAVQAAPVAKAKKSPAPKPPSTLDMTLLKRVPAGLEIVYCTRLPYRDGHWYANIGYYSTNELDKAYFGNGKPDQSALYRYNVATKQKQVIFDAQGGSVRDPTVHYDGKTILFSYRPANTDYFNLYTIQPDGTGMKQITRGPWDDYEPCWLPDGDIVFVSTRCKRWVGCWFTQVGILHRCKPDGSKIVQLSASIEHDNTPVVLPDGRILFMRWEYVDRSQVEYHALWTMNPDGTSVNVFYGNMHSWTVMIDGQPIPGTQEIIASFSPGHGRNEHRGVPTIVSPLQGPDCLEAAVKLSKSANYHDPIPLNKDLFMMAIDRSIVVMDRNGKECPLYVDSESNVHEPRPLLPRPREAVLASRTAEDLHPTGRAEGQFVLQNAYLGRNMVGVQPGDIKKLLVLEVLPKTINFSGGMDLTTASGSFNIERVLGTVPVEEDGSASFIVPAGRALFFVALDKNDRSVKRMQSFCNVMPGESFTCVGCHEERNSAAEAKSTPVTLMALQRKPSAIEPFAGYPDVLDYQRDIQPVLDRNCVRCHSPEKRAGKLDLSAGVFQGFACSYRALLLRRLVMDGENGVGNRAPRTIGSAASPLLDYLGGKHKHVKASEKDWRTVWLWIESGCLYAGSCAAIRNTAEQNYYGRANSRAMSGLYTVMGRRCASCHKNTKEANVNGIPFNWGIRKDKEAPKWDRKGGVHGRLTTTNDPAALYDSMLLVNITHPENSAVLRVPLAKSAGGTEGCGKAIFKDTNDPDYQKILAGIKEANALYAAQPAWGMKGWKPNKDYIREMKRYGVLPQTFDLEKDPFDPFAVDQAYWRSLWPENNPTPQSVSSK